jgi:hypothetical protein
VIDSNSFDGRLILFLQMLFEKFQNNPFASTAQCEPAENNHYETSLIPGRDIAAAAAVSNVILPGGEWDLHLR